MKLAVFADGTWNQMREKGTNVLTLRRMAVDDERQGQKVFYDEGVGTNWGQKLSGGLFGMGISQNIVDGYEFLVENWAGDPSPTKHDIFLFGFSRGAYTVRSLAGLLGRIGLVKNKRDIKEAYDLYRKAMDKKHHPAIAKFQAEKVATQPKIKMIGVWDTVGALGIPLNVLNRLNPFPHKFHDTALSPHVEAAYHAVAIDERRVAYEPSLWDPLPADSPQILEQVFFPGAHSDVGGGYHDDRRLGEITLEWIARRARRHGLLLKADPRRCTVEDSYGVIHSPMRYVPIRRAPRKIANGKISRVVRHRWEARENAFRPYPYDTANLDRKGDHPWMEWPEEDQQ